MKKLLGVVTLALLVALAGFAIANAAEEKKAEAKQESTTLTGEVVDLACYMGHGVSGEKHKQCAVTCAAGGAPIGLLTEKGVVYLIMPPHDNKDGFNKAKEWAGTKVILTGNVYERGGIKSIEVASAKQAPAAKTATN
jgi:hypothetical protein